MLHRPLFLLRRSFPSSLPHHPLHPLHHFLPSRSLTGYIVVKQGDRIALWSNGKPTIVDGPYRAFVVNKEVKQIAKVVASPKQYIYVEHWDGRVEHVHGPAMVYEDPLTYKQVVLMEGLELKVKDGIAVWKKGKSEITLLRGPRTYLPEPDEIHTQVPWYHANQNQFLKVTYLDGTIGHLRGPVEMWTDPSKYLSIKLEDCSYVEPGQAVEVYHNTETNEQGKKKSKRIEGPQIFLPQPFEIIVKLPSYIAGDLQYIRIVYSNGKIEHRSGPCVVWQDPDTMKNVSVQAVIQIESQEAIVLYSFLNDEPAIDLPTLQRLKELEKQGNVSKRVVHGPRVLIPQPNEWIHNFCWHGTDPNGRKDGQVCGRKLPGVLVFKKLRLVPDQLYYDSEGVRTADDALLTMKFMLYYEIVNVEKLLQQTHDPIAELINSLMADAIEFTNLRTFEQYKADTELLGKITTYKQILERADRIGIKVSQIVYRGYHSSDKLQLMHDEAIEARTKLKLDSETEHQALELEDLRMRRRQEREIIAQQIEVENMKHEVWKSQQKIEQELKEESSKHDLKLTHNKENNKEQLHFIEKLAQLGVNLTHYLTAQYQHPDKILKIENIQSSSSSPKEVLQPPHFHLKI